MNSKIDAAAFIEALVACGAASRWLTAGEVFNLAARAHILARRNRNAKALYLHGFVRSLSPYGDLSFKCARLAAWLNRHVGVQACGFVLERSEDLMPTWRIAPVREAGAGDDDEAVADADPDAVSAELPASRHRHVLLELAI
jgi:hypothetical protein